MSRSPLGALATSLALLPSGCGPSERSIVVYGVPEDLVVELRSGATTIEHRRAGDRVTARAAVESISLHTRGPCGEVELPLHAIDSFGQPRLEHELGEIATRRLLVDTRDARATDRVVVGQQTLDLPRGVMRSFEILEPTCAEGRFLRIGDEGVGELPSDSSIDVLVDVRGTHCYRLDRADRISLILITLDQTSATTTLDRLTPARLHTLTTHVDFPFAPVPDRIDLDEIAPRRDDEGHYAITSLVSIPCESDEVGHSPK